MLKSLSSMSTFVTLCSVSFCWSLFQKGGWSCGAFGAYTLSIVRFEVSLHFTERRSTLPGMSSVVVVWFGCRRSLLIINATPANAPGLSGFIEVWRAILLSKSW